MARLLLIALFLTACGSSGAEIGPCGEVSRDRTGSGIGAGSPPELVIEPEGLTFSHAAAETQTVELKNVGLGCLVLSMIGFVETTPGAEFERGLDWQYTANLATDETLLLDIMHVPDGPEADEAYVELVTNDPATINGRRLIPVTAAAAAD